MQQFCKDNLVSGGIHCPFWEGFPLCDIHLSIMPDVLHQLYQGVVKHMIAWCISEGSMSIGMKVGHLWVIFKLPEAISHLQLINIQSWPKEPLAYVEWYQLSHSPGQHHNMYSIVSPKPALRGESRDSRVIPGAVVLLKSIRQSCQLIPLEHIGKNWPAEWMSTAVLDQCSTFLLNNWSSKYAYQTIW